MKKSRTSQLLTLALTAATALVTLPAIAQADHRDRDRDRYEHVRHPRRAPVYHHGASCASRHYGDYRESRGHRRGHWKSHEAYRHPYACEPCSRSFRSWRSLRHHVHRHHHVSPWRLSRLLVRHGPLWVFVG